MAITRSNPPTLHAPVGAYHHVNVVEAGSRVLFAAGQIGVGADGALVRDRRAQIEQAWRNVRAVVEAAGMTHRDIVRLTVYMVGTQDVEFSRECRNRTIEGEKPGSTLLFVAGLADPEMIIEIDVVAAAYARPPSSATAASGSQEADEVLERAKVARGHRAGLLGAAAQHAVDIAGIGHQALHLRADRAAMENALGRPSSTSLAWRNLV